MKWLVALAQILALCQTVFCQEDAADTVELSLDWAMSWGTWGEEAYCQPGTFAYAFEIKVEDPTINDDNTAMNGIRLYCSEDSDSVISAVSEWGNWKGKRYCDDGYLTGLRMKSEKDQGSGDNTAANDLDMRCNSSRPLNGGGAPWGIWSSWEICPEGMAICGLQTRIDDDDDDDLSAVNDVRMFCCEI